MITVLETKCYPKAFTLSSDGKTPITNGDWSMWFQYREQAQTKADAMNLAQARTDYIDSLKRVIASQKDLIEVCNKQINAQTSLINLLLSR